MADRDALFRKMVSNDGPPAPAPEPNGVQEYGRLLSTFKNSVYSIKSFIDKFQRNPPTKELKKIVVERANKIDDKTRKLEQKIDVYSDEIKDSLDKNTEELEKEEHELESDKISLDKSVKSLNKSDDEVDSYTKNMNGAFLEFLKFDAKNDYTKTYKSVNDKINKSFDAFDAKIKERNAHIQKSIGKIDINKVKDVEKSYTSMIKKYGKKFIDNTFGRVLRWAHSMSSTITKVFSWIKEKGIAVFSWFKNVAMHPLQSLWDMTKTLAKIGWESIKTVFTVLSWPVKKAMNFLVKALKTILFNPIVFIPLVIAATMMAAKFFDIFAPVIAEIFSGAWKHVKKVVGRWIKVLDESVFGPIWNTVSGWVTSFIQWVFSEEHAKMVEDVLIKYLGISFDDIKSFLDSTYDFIMELPSHSIWSLLGKASVWALKKAWEKILGLLGYPPNTEQPSGDSGTVSEAEGQVGRSSKQLRRAMEEGDTVVNDAVDRSIEEMNEQVQSGGEELDSNIESEATRHIDESNEELRAEQEQRTTELTTMGDKANNEMLAGMDKGFADKIDPKIANAQKAAENAKKEIEFGKKMKNAVGKGENVDKAAMDEIRKERRGGRRAARSARRETKQEFKDRGKNLKNIQDVTEPAMKKSSTIPKTKIDELPPPSNRKFGPPSPKSSSQTINTRSVSNSRKTVSFRSSRVFHSVLDKRKAELAASVAKFESGETDGQERISAMRREIAQMEDIGTDKSEMLAYISDNAPHYQVMSDLIYWNHVAKKFGGNKAMLSPDERVSASSMHARALERIDSLNAQLTTKTMTGSSRQYQALTPDKIKFEDGKIIITNNWTQDPIFVRIIQSKNYRKGPVPTNISEPDIPEVEIGGVVTDSTLALVGEGMVSEVILPLNERGVTFFVDSINHIINDSNKELSRDEIERKEQEANSSITRVIASEAAKADLTLYDMKLLATGEIGAG